MHELISDRDISDESIYVVYQFLTDLLAEFESKAYSRLKSYHEELEAIKKELWLQNGKDNQPF